MSKIIKSPSVSGTTFIDYKRSLQKKSDLLIDAISKRTDDGFELETPASPSLKDEFLIDDPVELLQPEVDAARKVYEGEISLLNSENDALKEKIQSLTSDYETLKAEMDELRSSISSARDKAIDSGYAQGMDKAQQDYKNELSENQKRLEAAVKTFEVMLDGKYATDDTLSIEIAFAIFLKIYGDSLGDFNFIGSLMKNALKELRVGRSATIHLTTHDYDVVMKNIDAIKNMLPIEDITFNKDQRITTGGCIIESKRGTWDARLETQLQRINESLNLKIGS